MMWMDVNTALSEVPVNAVALIDNTDFKSREESVAYNAAGLELIWHFTTTAGNTTHVVVTPTTGGDYDWAHQDGALYTIEIPASGGVSINNDTKGFGWFTGVADGVLPWTGPVIGFRQGTMNNFLIDNDWDTKRGLAGTALPNAAADAAGGLPISDGGALDLDAMNTAAVRLTAVRAAVLTDLINDGRLDALIDAILLDTGTTLDALIKDVPTVAEFEARSDVAGTAATPAEVNTEVDTALSDINLDHLMKTATVGANMTAEIVDNTALSRILANGDTSAFTPSTDGLQPIRDRGDAAWAGAPESVSGTIVVNTADTIFDLTATSGTLSTIDDTYNNMIICILDNSGSVYETARITDYVGASTRITIDHELTFPVDDGVDTFVIYRAAYAPVGAASITEGDKDDIVDKVYDESVKDHQTAGSGGYHLKRAGQRY